MARKTRSYSRIEEASEIIHQLYEKYPKAFWAVNPSSIAVMGIDNIERSEKAVLKNPIYSKMRNIKGVERALFQENNITERYIIELFWSDWNSWKQSTKAAVLANHMFEITPDTEVKNKPDCIGFKILYDVLGVTWEKDDGQNIPDLLLSDIEFNMDLRPGLDDIEDIDVSEVED